ncbi:MAG: hypothetical protein DHS20C11_16240 [Lysobacteraceae bacterium]|nr:MAG: hypothetical protein DHS20C11_16240 [Xanthomonadaceae bacterium]
MTRYLFAITFFVATLNGHAQVRGFAGDPFVYQGELLVSGIPAQGTYDFLFILYDDNVTIDMVAIDDVPVNDGVFTIELEFDNGYFRNIDDPEMAVEVFDDDASAYVTIAPKQDLLPTPIAHYALAVPDASIDSDKIVNGSVQAHDVNSASIQERVSDACTTGFAIRSIAADGSVVCESVTASSDDAWLLDGNAGTTASDFLGTTDNQPLELRTNDQRALRLEWGFSSSGAPNLIGGVSTNSIPASSEGSVIAGGGALAAPNTISGSGSAIGGGVDNQINGSWSAIPGGRANRVNGNDAIAMGRSAQANHNNTFVWSSGGTFASTADDQFLLNPDGGVGIGVNNPSDYLHVSAPGGSDALRVQIGGTTRLRVHDNGGVSIGANVGPPAAGLVVSGDIRYRDPRTRWVTVSPTAFRPSESGRQFEITERSLRTISNLTAGDRTFYAPVQLPHGATVTEMKATIHDNYSSVSMEITLLRKPYNSSLFGSSMAVINTGGQSSAVRTITDSSITGATIDNETYTYAIKVFTPEFHSFQVYGVRIAYLASTFEP